MIKRLILALIPLLAACSPADSSTARSQDVGTTADTIAPSPQSQKVSSPLTFAFCGDIMMGTTYPDSTGAYLPSADGAHLFDDVREVLSSATLAAGNLEGTLLDRGGTVKKCGNPALCYAFRMPTRYARHLVDAGIDFVGIANNHANDFGASGVSSTRSTLENAGIVYAGRKDCPTAIMGKDGRRIGFAVFAHSTGTPSIMNLEEVRRTVTGLKKQCDIVVVSFHGGGEGKKYTHVPHAMEECFGEKRGNVEAFAHAAVDAGADVVFGHGPHVTRALELYRDRLIMYSLGNFCTPYRVNLDGISGHAPVVTVQVNDDGTFAGGQIHSFIQTTGKGPRRDATCSVARQMRELSRQDFPASPLRISPEGVLSR